MPSGHLKEYLEMTGTITCGNTQLHIVSASACGIAAPVCYFTHSFLLEWVPSMCQAAEI